MLNKHGIELVEIIQTTGKKNQHRMVWLTELVRRNGWTSGAEIGLHKGQTMFYMLQQCNALHMIGVDAWMQQPENPGQQTYTEPHWTHDKWSKHCKALAAKNPRATVIHAPSIEAADRVHDGSLDFVFIDADHNQVAEDIAAWKPKLKPTGKLCGHDINWLSVKTDVDRLIVDYDIGPNETWIAR